MKKKTEQIVVWPQEKIQAFQADFLTWYAREGRILPWRENQDPYRVWVSEIMLQQTRVDTVIPYFERFMDWFPSIQALAEAPEDRLLKAWEGLGYYSRVRNLQKAAQQIMTDFDGKMPTELTDILSLKGIGPYTAGAIASIAFNQPEPAVDGNVMRVFSRLFTLNVDIAKPSSRKVFEEVVKAVISPTDPGAFNQAIMDLGATVCTPTSPKCQICPLKNYCQAFANDTMTQYPVKTKKSKPKPVYYLTVAIQNEEGAYLFEKRAEQGLLANMWMFPVIEVSETSYKKIKKAYQSYQKNPPKAAQYEQLSLIAEADEPYEMDNNYNFGSFLKQEATFDSVVWQKQPLGEVTHIFSHLKWVLLLGYGRALSDFTPTEQQRWLTLSQATEYVLPKHQQKLNNLLSEEKNK